jgi:hypothetical protein
MKTLVSLSPLGQLFAFGTSHPATRRFGSVGFTVPHARSLVGQVIYTQAILIAYPNDLRLSNVVTDVIQ